MPLPDRLEDGDVQQMCFSTDGKTIFVRGSGVGHVSGFDVASGKRLFRFQPDADGVSAFDVSPDGKILATAGGGSGKIILWKADSKEKLRTLVGHKNAAALAPKVNPFAPDLGTSVFVQAVAFSPDGKWLASRALYDDWVRVFDVQTGQQKYTFACASLYGTGVWFSPEGYLAAYRPNGGPAPAQKPAIVLWDLQTGKVHQEFEWVPQWGPGYHGLAFSPDGKWMAGDRGKSRICVWNRATGQIRFTDPRPISPCGSLVFSKDGDTLVTSDAASLDMWDLKTGRSVLADGGHTGMIRGFDLSSDGTTIATGGTDATIRLWDAKTGKELHRLEGVGSVVVFSPNGKTLVSSAGTIDGGMILWDVATGKELRRFLLEKDPQGVQPSGVSAAFSPDGKTLAVGTNLNITYVFFDVATGKEKRRASWHTGLGGSTSWAPCCFSPDGKHFAGMYGPQGNFYVPALWDMTKAAPQTLIGAENHVFDVAFSTDGEYLAWWDIDQVHIWDVREKRPLKSFKGGGRLAFSPDGHYLAAGKKLYPLSPKYPPLELPVHPGYQAFSPDSKTLVVVPQDQATVLVLDVKKLAKSK
jgi:WD40 repeat protein